MSAGGARRSIVVYPHSMELGGSQLNAIELGAAVRDRGHEVVIYGPPGPLADHVRTLGLELVVARPAGRRPSPAIARDLAALARARSADVLHGYEWPPALEARAAAVLSRRAVAVVTVMSMAVAPFLPDSVPLVVGTRRIQESTARLRRGPVHLIEPPVDAESNRPDLDGGRAAAEFLARASGDAEGRRVVIVSRLARELKLEGILTAIVAVQRLAASIPVQLLIVGDGPARTEVEAAAEAANRTSGRPVVRMVGALADPRGAYDAADVVIGMGGSALRALAFAKPLVVQGERGFFEVLDPRTAPVFLEQGWYGVGGLDPATPGGRAAAADRLIDVVAPLLADGQARTRLGAYGRRLLEERFSLTAAAVVQEAVYEQALVDRPGALRTVRDGTVSAAGLVRHKVGRRLARLRGPVSRDDFNAKPV